ncbi:hypothetical protein PsYK624_152640 [Phanerochaete sordida]|uniref:Uncharacterized protein n=1 Tax=Phanerochaete sordida TaxID=48140 RepID=A0A9P3LKZ1_9APHY|nr:hypothetical protein PsYK624_152640 [Phanerochaete sordida]
MFSIAQARLPAVAHRRRAALRTDRRPSAGPLALAVSSTPAEASSPEPSVRPSAAAAPRTAAVTAVPEPGLEYPACRDVTQLLGRSVSLPFRARLMDRGGLSAAVVGESDWPAHASLITCCDSAGTPASTPEHCCGIHPPRSQPTVSAVFRGQLGGVHDKLCEKLAQIGFGSCHLQRFPPSVLLPSGHGLPSVAHASAAPQFPPIRPQPAQTRTAGSAAADRTVAQGAQYGLQEHLYGALPSLAVKASRRARSRLPIAIVSASSLIEYYSPRRRSSTTGSISTLVVSCYALQKPRRIAVADHACVEHLPVPKSPPF